jgi:hypothetical protein
MYLYQGLHQCKIEKEAIRDVTTIKTSAQLWIQKVYNEFRDFISSSASS